MDPQLKGQQLQDSNVDGPRLESQTGRANLFMEFKRGAMVFLGDIASFNNFILLSLTYFLGVGTSAIIMRLFGKKADDGKAQNTYWSDVNVGGKDADSYYRPF